MTYGSACSVRFGIKIVMLSSGIGLVNVFVCSKLIVIKYIKVNTIILMHKHMLKYNINTVSPVNFNNVQFVQT